MPPRKHVHNFWFAIVPFKSSVFTDHYYYDCMHATNIRAGIVRVFLNEFISVLYRNIKDGFLKGCVISASSPPFLAKHYLLT